MIEHELPQEINLVKKTVYDKANSILEIRGIEQKKSFILKNLRRHFDDVKMLSSKDPFRQVLCDLFDESSDEMVEGKVSYDPKKKMYQFTTKVVEKGQGANKSILTSFPISFPDPS